MSTLLELRDVVAGYGRVEVLHGVSMSVPEGSVVALLGPNGVGKTTTMNVISGILPVRAGRLSFDGRAINRTQPDRRARMGITLIPEGRGVFPGLSVQDNLEIATTPALRLEASERERTMVRTLELFPRLRERLTQRAGTLSGGEQQMLSLARALLSAPRVLLMDEISMGLAPRIVGELFDVVGELRDQGLTIVLVEQYLTYALRLADICYVMGRGRINFVGEPDELRGSAAASYLAS